MVIVITGPTAVGKTKLSIELAHRFNGEIINADSTQVYQGMDIATAKVTEEEKENIHHHLFDIKKITEDYSVYDYQKDGRKKIEQILKNGKTPILVGGTGLYIKALLYNYEFQSKNENLKEYDEIETIDLFKQLKQVDPNTEIHPNNRRRIIRALEYFNQFQTPFSQKEKSEELLYDAVFLGLTTSRDILYNRINQRVDIMVQNGLLEEAKKIYDSKIRTKAVLTPIGYKELFPYFDGVESLEDCLSKIKQNSRRYAKKQYTWFRHQLPIHWIEVNFDNFEKTVEEAEKYVKEGF